MSEIKKIVQIADIQFRNYQRQDEFKSVCTKFLYDMEDVKPDRIVICGDVVHSKNQISPELVDIVSWFLESCANIAKTIMIPGNHDFLENNHDRLDALSPIVKALGHKNLFYYKECGLYPDENVNWAVYSLFDNNARPEGLNKPKEAGRVNIGLYHGPVYGMKQSGISEGYDYVYDYGGNAATFMGCDIVLAGDLHLRQVVSHGDIPIIMVGSMVQQNQEETLSMHGYCTIEIPSLKYAFTDIDNQVKYLKIKINDFNDIFENREILLNP